MRGGAALRGAQAGHLCALQGQQLRGPQVAGDHDRLRGQWLRRGGVLGVQRGEHLVLEIHQVIHALAQPRVGEGSEHRGGGAD